MKDDIQEHAYLQACLIDYQSVRNEIVVATQHLYLVFVYGVTASIAFLGGALSLLNVRPFIAPLALGFLIPMLNFWFIEMIFSHIRLILRNSKYCLHLERRLSFLVGESFWEAHRPSVEHIWSLGFDGRYPVGWHAWLDGGKDQEDKHMGLHLRMAVGLFIVLSFVSAVIYIYTFPFHALSTWKRWQVITLMLAPVAIEGVKNVLLLRQITQIVRPLPAIPRSLLRFVQEVAPSGIRFIIVTILTLVRQLRSKIQRVIGVGLSRTATIRSTFDLSAFVAVIAQGALLYFAVGWRAVVIYAFVIGAATIASAYARSQKTNKDSTKAEARTWKNSLANTGIATILALLARGFPLWPIPTLTTMMIASLAAGLSDTLSHEIGVLYGGTPRRITSFDAAPAGESGAISGVGTLSGIVTAFGVGFVGLSLGIITARQALFVGGCGFAGNVIDSVLGATLEQRGFIDNNGVNTACTVSAACLVLIVSITIGI